MMENISTEESRNSHLKFDYMTLVTMFIQIRASNEVLLKNQAIILAKLNNEDADALLKNFKEAVNNEVVESLKSMQ